MIDALETFHRSIGGTLAADGVPQHYGDLAAEWRAANDPAGGVWMERSHEGRVRFEGASALAIVHRLSTNDVERLGDGEAAPTVFLTPNARIIDRVLVVRQRDGALILTEGGRGQAVGAMLKRNLFFNDDARVVDIAGETRQFVLHGAAAGALIEAMLPGAGALEVLRAGSFAWMPPNVNTVNLIIVRDKPLIGGHWRVLVPTDAAVAFAAALHDAGRAHGAIAAGSLTYYALRIGAGRGGAGREWSEDTIPLEVGLWDEISFRKGCYTGQEIIARMESRGKLARALVSLQVDAPPETPAPLVLDGREVGTMTSAARLPTGETIGLGVVRLAAAEPGTMLSLGTGTARVVGLAGIPPPMAEG